MYEDKTLICKECGSEYRRQIWSKYGEKKAVWRCENRLRNGTRYCKDSPTIEESVLHRAVLHAINQVLENKDEFVQTLRKNVVTALTHGTEDSEYAKEKKIVSGKIFLTRNNTELSRKQIWAEMKALCKGAKIAPGKVFPHNLRHLFARTFYQESQDIAKLADVLGHSSIETTRIYLISSGEEHSRKLNRLNLLL